MTSSAKLRLTALGFVVLVMALIGGGMFLGARWNSPPALAHSAVSPASLKYRGYVNDFAGVIDPDPQQRITQLATDLDQKTRTQIAVVTIETLGDDTIEDFSNRLFQAWGIGHKDTRGATAACSRDCGLLLLLVTKDHKSRLEVGYGLEPIIPDGFAGGVLRDMRPALRQNRYGDALFQACGTLAGRIATQAGVQLDSYVPRGPYHRESGEPVPSWFVVIIVFAIILFGAPWWFAFRGIRRWGGGWGGGGGFGGGGFGGYDSGGSSGGGFEGFGGGESGGGGASSDW